MTYGELINAYEKEVDPNARIDTDMPIDWLLEARRNGDVTEYLGWIYDDRTRIFGRPIPVADAKEALAKVRLARQADRV